MNAKSLMLALPLPLLMWDSSARADDLRAAMEASNQQWLNAFNTPNPAAFPAMYTDDAILAAAKAKGYDIVWALETHAHADHLSGSPYIKARTGARIGI